MAPPLVDVSGNNLQITFERARADITYTVERSDDLTGWSTLVTNPGFVGTNVTVTDTAGLATQSKSFLRLKVTAL